MVKGNWEEIEQFIEDTGNQKAGWFAREGKRQRKGALLWLEQIINTDLRKYPFKGALIDFKFARQFISQDIVEDNRSISLAVSGV